MQDQYAAAYGGLNFIEFAADDQVEVRPLAVAGEVMEALERSLLLAWSGDSRTDDGILRRQVDGVLCGSERSLASLGALKGLAEEMRDALLGGDLATFAEGLRQGWEHKRRRPPGSPPARQGARRRRWGLHAVRRAAGAAGADGGRAGGRPALPARRSASTCAAPTPPTGGPGGADEHDGQHRELPGQLGRGGRRPGRAAGRGRRRAGRPAGRRRPGRRRPGAALRQRRQRGRRPASGRRAGRAPPARPAGLPGGRPHHRHLGADRRRQRLRLRRRVRPPGRGPRPARGRAGGPLDQRPLRERAPGGGRRQGRRHGRGRVPRPGRLPAGRRRRPRPAGRRSARPCSSRHGPRSPARGPGRAAPRHCAPRSRAGRLGDLRAVLLRASSGGAAAWRRAAGSGCSRPGWGWLSSASRSTSSTPCRRSRALVSTVSTTVSTWRSTAPTRVSANWRWAARVCSARSKVRSTAPATSMPASGRERRRVSCSVMSVQLRTTSRRAVWLSRTALRMGVCGSLPRRVVGRHGWFLSS